MAMYSQFEKDRDQGNFELLPELHAILSGMKVNAPPLPLSGNAWFCAMSLLGASSWLCYPH